LARDLARSPTVWLMISASVPKRYTKRDRP
jgi:hypothetical protein